MYYHVILFKFATTLTSDEAYHLFHEIGELQKEISQIVSYHFGANDGANAHNKTFSHCFVMTFANKKDRYLYQNHPLHQAFIKNRLEPLLDDAIVLDFDGL
ncbi:MAG: Dabb family protein [Legionella sp.]|nr:Dabb family protein [Legionella sp.]